MLHHDGVGVRRRHPCALRAYSWLYQSSLYLVLAGVLAIGLFIVCRLLDRRGGDPDVGAWTTPLYVGAVLTAGSVVALLL